MKVDDLKQANELAAELKTITKMITNITSRDARFRKHMFLLELLHGQAHEDESHFHQVGQINMSEKDGAAYLENRRNVIREALQKLGIDA